MTCCWLHTCEIEKKKKSPRRLAQKKKKKERSLPELDRCVCARVARRYKPSRALLKLRIHGRASVCQLYTTRRRSWTHIVGPLGLAALPERAAPLHSFTRTRSHKDLMQRLSLCLCVSSGAVFQLEALKANNTHAHAHTDLRDSLQSVQVDSPLSQCSLKEADLWCRLKVAPFKINLKAQCVTCIGHELE